MLRVHKPWQNEAFQILRQEAEYQKFDFDILDQMISILLTKSYPSCSSISSSSVVVSAVIKPFLRFAIWQAIRISGNHLPNVLIITASVYTIESLIIFINVSKKLFFVVNFQHFTKPSTNLPCEYPLLYQSFHPWLTSAVACILCTIFQPLHRFYDLYFQYSISLFSLVRSALFHTE